MCIVGLLSALILYAVPNYSLEKGYRYDEEEVANAQNKIRQEMPAEIHRVLHDSPPTPYVERIRAETPEFRRRMIEFARKMAYPLPGCTEHTWENGLFMYRDEATVRKFISKCLDEGEFRHYGKYLGDSADPEVIRLMGPFLFDSTLIPNSREAGFPPIPKDKWVAIRLCQYTAIQGCVEFPEEVRVWNRRLAAIGPPSETQLAIMQHWWKENEAAFRARAWDKVKPGVLEIPGMPKSLLVNPPVFDEPETSPAMNGSALPNSTAPSLPSPLATAAEFPTPSIGTLWTCAAAATALSISLLVFWRRRHS